MEMLKLFVVPVKDLHGAKSLFRTLLGVEPYADAPYYVGFRVGEQEIGLDPNGHQSGLSGPIGYFQVEDIEATLSALESTGATVAQPLRTVGPGRRIAWVKDADGNIMGLMEQAAG
jgi:predicted enzyme related to lactoylglutathione lyase